MNLRDQDKTKEKLIAELEELRIKVAQCEEILISRKQSEDALRKVKASLADAQRIAHLGSWEWDIVKNELYWSDEIYRIFGLDPLGFSATYEAFLNSVHPDDRELVKKAVDVALSGGEIYSIDHRIVLPNGVIRIVHEYAEVTSTKR